jgi:toxin ParE1/3/4
MMLIEWSPKSLQDLDRIFAYIAQRSERSALNIIDQIERSTLPVAQFPYMFRSGRIEGTREIVAHPNYIVIYRVLNDRVRVVGVVHSAQEYP